MTCSFILCICWIYKHKKNYITELCNPLQLPHLNIFPNFCCLCQDHSCPSFNLSLHCFKLYHASTVQTKQVIVIRGNASMNESHTVPFPGPS